MNLKFIGMNEKHLSLAVEKYHQSHDFWECHRVAHISPDDIMFVNNGVHEISIRGFSPVNEEIIKYWASENKQKYWFIQKLL